MNKVVTESESKSVTAHGIFNRILKAAIKTKYPFASQPIRLDIITKQNREFLSECLKVSGNRSLTGMVDKVKIQDKISNEYAFILREFNINKPELFMSF